MTVYLTSISQVDNLGPDKATLPTVADQIANALKEPDLVFLQEIEDSSGETPDGTVDATKTLNNLIASIKTAGGEANYGFTEVISVDGQDGGVGGGNIRPAYL